MHSSARGCALVRASVAMVSVVLTSGRVAYAAPSLFASAGGTYGSANGTATAGSISRSSDGQDANGQNNQRAAARFGVLQTFANSSSVASNSSSFSFFSQAVARSVDDWTFNAPGRAGQSGSVTVRFTIDGDLSISNTGSARFESIYFQAYSRAGYRFGQAPQSDTKQQTHRTDGAVSGAAFLGIEQTARLDFTFGQQLNDITWQVSSITNATGDYSNWTSKATSDIEHAATWGGFVDVKDANGNVINNYTFSSASGFDWSKTIRAAGDATFDGIVNFDDLVLLAQNYNKLTGATFGQGDFNGDGAVNFDDLVPLAQHYNQSVSSALESSLEASFAADWALAQSIVPEPGAIALLGGLGALADRRRRSPGARVGVGAAH